MSVFDLLAVLTMASAAAAGWQMGFIHRASSWLAMALGLAVALALVPPVLGALEGVQALPALEPLLADRDPQLRDAAKRALGRIQLERRGTVRAQP